MDPRLFEDEINFESQEYHRAETTGNPGSPPTPHYPTSEQQSNRDEDTDEAGTTTTRRAGKRTSDVWQWFDQIRGEDPTTGQIIQQAKCKYCSSILKAISQNGTGHLRRHYMKKHANIPPQPSQTTLSFTDSGGLQNWQYDPTFAREALARFVANSDLPINIGENQFFEEFIQTAHNPQFKKCSKTTTRNDLIKLFKKLKRELKDKILSCHVNVALTADIWSGRNRQDFLCVTCHYVDKKFNLSKAVLGFRELNHSHNAQIIYETICEILIDYDLIEKVTSITMDNATANTKAIEIFQNSHLYFNQLHFFHQRCACHIINLIVKSGLKQVKENIENVRNCLSWIIASNSRIKEFSRFCKAHNMQPKKFALDMPIRWNSTYLMLNNAIPYREIIDMFCVSKNGPKLEEKDWFICEKFRHFLETFYDATCQLSGIYYPTTTLIIKWLGTILLLFSKFKYDNDLNLAIQKMFEKF